MIMLFIVGISAHFSLGAIYIDASVILETEDNCQYVLTEPITTWGNFTLNKTSLIVNESIVYKGDSGICYFPLDSGVGSDSPVTVAQGGGSSSEVARAYNPEAYDELSYQWGVLWSGTELEKFPDALLRTFILFMEYIFKQPASFVPMGMHEGGL